MSDKPHTVAIGAFIVGALLIAISTVLFVVGSGFGSHEKIVMAFDGSLMGLNIGAPLALRGIQVGQVTDIEAILDPDTLDLIMLVEADFDGRNIQRKGDDTRDLTEELIQRGMRAQLNSQSLLTGLLYVQLDFHPGSELVLADINSPYLQFPTIPTEMERIAKKLENLDFSKLSDNLDATLAGLNTIINSEALQSLPVEAHDTLASLTSLSEQLQAQLTSSGPRLDTLLDEASATVATANKTLPGLALQLKGNLSALHQAVTAFEKTMTDLDRLVEPDSATTYQLNQALRELAQAGRSLQLLAKTLEEQPEALLRGRSGKDQ
jgi:paraquat-inducible protein B